MSEIEKYSEQTFEHYRNVNEYGEDFWYARDLAQILDYKRFDKFLNVIDKAKTACLNSGYEVEDHFSQVGKMVELGSGAIREVEDYELSRYACYLVVQNADPKKEVVALGQTYFAVQTRKQELQEQFETLDEDKKRLAIRNELKAHNKSLQEAAMLAGVETNFDYATFQNHGYRGLYGGLDAKGIHARKGLKKSHKILDHMGSTELAANLFRATQTDEKLRRENVQGKENANRAHYEVGKKVRQTIEELGGTMPEDLPTPEKSIKQIEKIEQKKLLNKDK
ncbi:DNA damage-inducible protein D [Lysinibacillus odysseyi]|uniref:Damage-inducible protein D n=1 Tax=Lysinibacillus odysseyi 34hs-1 = NBRC 100172 TaxID=1220589 RepID=A0A0A3IH48_9BACI|nr:DNA damage-inducible protein D [Lysinibacillus odysseyi]KGR82765.1 damage-inducible protein D [Lysinibacillus odysseyi 34hs-1 = NBRC 100172]